MSHTVTKRPLPRVELTPKVSAPPLLAPLLGLFVLSGIAALIYEVIWFQLLELVIGSSAISLGVLLATYMGGMCAGSLILPRLTRARVIPPLRLYAYLELAIGGCGVFVLAVVPLVSGVYSAIAGHGPFAIFVRALVCAICLLPPTILMGATLPTVSRYVESTPKGVAWIGFLYGGNTIGAVFGSVLAGFYLLRIYDLTIATIAAVAINALVAGLGLLLLRSSSAVATGPEQIDHPRSAQSPLPSAHSSAHIAIALSGAAALGAEVVWTRLLSLMLGATTYTFSMILGVFLTGLGLGSAIGAMIGRAVARPITALGWCQVLQMLAVAFAALMVGSALPYWPINPSLAPSPWFTFQLDLTRCIWVVLPAACLWGASFPLALAAAAERDDDPARLVGGVYAANTIGGIVGALAFSLLLVPSLGTQQSQRAIVLLAGVAAVVMFASLSRSSRRGMIAGLAATTAIAILATIATPAVPGLLVAYGRYMVTWLGQVDVKYVGEGMNSSVAVTTLTSSGATQFHVSGKVEASTLPQDMRLQRMLADLPALVHPRPRSVLVVGFGAGVTAGSFVPYPEMQRLTICEIEPLIPQVVSRYFTRENNDVLNDPRTHVVYDDARSFILTTREKFDIITSDPIHPWVKGAASLYTKEYFEAVKEHLNAGGVVTQWVPLYESTPEAVKSELATFFSVFPHGTVWANNINGGGYDLVLLGQTAPTRIDINAIASRFGAARYAAVAQSLGDVGFGSPVALFSTYAGAGADLALWLADASVNRDRNLRLQYLAAVGLNSYRSEAIYGEIAKYRRFPSSLFVADDAWLARLRAAMPDAP